MISSWEIEKQLTPFNFRRPTATIIDDSTATKVETIIPTDWASENVLRKSNLTELGATDVVIFGEVHRLTQLVSGITWGSQHPNGLFAWHTFESEGGKSITMLGCREGLWGEAAGSLVRVLRKFSKTQCLIYVSKVGSLAENVSANERIATGDESTLGDKDIAWDDPLRDMKSIASSDLVLRGRHVSVPSPLCETKEWLRHWQETCAWVDCETWHMAQAAKDVEVKFGYLHIVSDNLAEEDGENLSNEDCDEIQNANGNPYVPVAPIAIPVVGGVPVVPPVGGGGGGGGGAGADSTTTTTSSSPSSSSSPPTPTSSISASPSSSSVDPITSAVELSSGSSIMEVVTVTSPETTIEVIETATSAAPAATSAAPSPVPCYNYDWKSYGWCCPGPDSPCQNDLGTCYFDGTGATNVLPNTAACPPGEGARS
ncbi:hypothetical protein CABS01_05791 [Colletotrichum abscissum]|uniref:uncharacterized protein n=1 Tax=Colletotrichum abscissum TaxID=1671311 RepID=UPI0027D639BA|nr:uncharacterized protein CABS01_05791 [Colletotrichum abscissum]KAK1518257.1 hypothetical protein CABS01_05791 [Colletotrichum abscissum]